jgi:curved DNA-binding protein
MSETDAVMSPRRARELLGVSAEASAGDLRAAFRDACKAAHPDRPGGDAARFRAVVEAYHILQRPTDEAKPPPRASQSRRPAPAAPPRTLTITPEQAVLGGEITSALPDGRPFTTTLPPGLRAGDQLRIGEAGFEVLVRGDGEVLVRGDDLWITLKVDPRLLAKGGRLTLTTPQGRRVVAITRKAGASGLVRLQGQGLPQRGRHRQGHLYLRLVPGDANAGGARGLLRRWGAAWAA